MFGMETKEFKQLSKEICTLVNAVNNIASKQLLLETNMNSLRGLVNRKLGAVKEEEEEEEETKDIKRTRYY